jgi:hypothetical protein
MSWSGFILYIAPPGRIANWGTWKLMLFTKTEWQALHTIFSYLFFILVIIHLFFINWKTFLTYFKSKLKAGLNKKWELGFAIFLSAVIFIGTLRSWTPFGPVMEFGGKVKENWGKKIDVPPVMHMETYTLEQLTFIFDTVPVANLKNTLLENGIKVGESDTTLRQIAEKNNRTPASVYDILTARFSKSSDHVQGQGSSGQGFGKYSLKMVAERSGKDLDDIIGILKARGIDAIPESTLRGIADQMGMTPLEVYNLVTGAKN